MRCEEEDCRTNSEEEGDCRTNSEEEEGDCRTNSKEERHLQSSRGNFKSRFISSALALISFSFFTVSLPMWFSLLMGSSREGISCFFRFLVRLVTTTNSSETAGLMLRRDPLLFTALTTILKGGRLVPASTDSLLSVTFTSLHTSYSWCETLHCQCCMEVRTASFRLECMRLLFTALMTILNRVHLAPATCISLHAFIDQCIGMLYCFSQSLPASTDSLFAVTFTSLHAFIMNGSLIDVDVSYFPAMPASQSTLNALCHLHCPMSTHYQCYRAKSCSYSLPGTAQTHRCLSPSLPCVQPTPDLLVYWQQWMQSSLAAVYCSIPSSSVCSFSLRLVPDMCIWILKGGRWGPTDPRLSAIFIFPSCVGLLTCRALGCTHMSTTLSYRLDMSITSRTHVLFDASKSCHDNRLTPTKPKICVAYKS